MAVDKYIFHDLKFSKVYKLPRVMLMSSQNDNMYPHDEMNKVWVKPMLDIMPASEETKVSSNMGFDLSDLS
jgi:hypothetical protein